MNLIKKVITPILLLIALIVVVIKMDTITEYIASFLKETPKIVIPPSNEYAKKNEYLFLYPIVDKI